MKIAAHLVDTHLLRPSRSMVWRFLHRRGVSRTTGHAREQQRPDVVRRRRAWFEAQPGLDPGHDRFDLIGALGYAGSSRPASVWMASSTGWHAPGFPRAGAVGAIAVRLCGTVSGRRPGDFGSIYPFEQNHGQKRRYSDPVRTRARTRREPG